MSKIVAKEHEISLIDAPNIHRHLIETLRSGIFLAEGRGRLIYVNHALLEILGYRIKDEVLGLHFADELLTDAQEKQTFLQRMYKTGTVQDFDIRHARKDGCVSYLAITVNHIYNDQGQVIGTEGVVRDITDKKRLEKELLTEKHKLELILGFDEEIGTIREFEPLVDFVVEKTAVILEARRCSLMLMDQNGRELFIQGAKGLEEEVIKGCRVKVGEMVAGYVAQSRTPLLVKNIEYDERFQRSSRLYYFSRSFMSVPVVLEDKVIGVLNVTDKRTAENFNEIDLRILGAIGREVGIAVENSRIYKELSHLTITDPLTLIYNYRQFSKSLSFEIKRCQRIDGNLCLIMMDLDDFKLYNDTFGHLEGDALLKEIGRILKSQLRETDIVCRYAGDEFTVILPDITTAGARIAAEKIRQAVEGASFKTKVTVSLGIAAYTPGITPYDLILKADRALYQAKGAGKNHIYVQE